MPHSILELARSISESAHSARSLALRAAEPGTGSAEATAALKALDALEQAAVQLRGASEALLKAALRKEAFARAEAWARNFGGAAPAALAALAERGAYAAESPCAVHRGAEWADAWLAGFGLSAAPGSDAYAELASMASGASLDRTRELISR